MVDEQPFEGCVVGSGGGVTGTRSREIDRSIVRCEGSILVEVAGSSPVPRLRSQRGCDPPATISRIRLPRANRCATASSFTRTRPWSVEGSSRTNPSLTLHERPWGSTSDTRTNRSAKGLSEL